MLHIGVRKIPVTFKIEININIHIICYFIRHSIKIVNSIEMILL